MKQNESMKQPACKYAQHEKYASMSKLTWTNTLNYSIQKIPMVLVKTHSRTVGRININRPNDRINRTDDMIRFEWPPIAANNNMQVSRTCWANKSKRIASCGVMIFILFILYIFSLFLWHVRFIVFILSYLSYFLYVSYVSYFHMFHSFMAPYLVGHDIVTISWRLGLSSLRPLKVAVPSGCSNQRTCSKCSSRRTCCGCWNQRICSKCPKQRDNVRYIYIYIYMCILFIYIYICILYIIYYIYRRHPPLGPTFSCISLSYLEYMWQVHVI